MDINLVSMSATAALALGIVISILAGAIRIIKPARILTEETTKLLEALRELREELHKWKKSRKKKKK